MVHCVSFFLFLKQKSYEMTTSSKNRSFFQEIFLAIVSSTILGTGIFFLLLWSGVYL
jgi:hypothetical protein